MAAYLKFYALERPPFGEASGARVVLGTKALREAFETIRSGLGEGASRICVSGGTGLGKTSLARALPKLLANEACVAVVLDPSLPWDSLRAGIARQWGLAKAGLARIRLLEASRKRRLVLVIDAAETASDEFLDHLDVLLCYRNEDESAVVQSVLLANLEMGEGRGPAPLIWWLDRIHTLQLEFAPLPRDGVAPYIAKHLRRAGWQGGALFTIEAAHAIHEITGGIPGEVGKLCERLLADAAGRDRLEIDADFVRSACDDGEDADETISLAGSGPASGPDEETWDADFPSRSEPSFPSRWGQSKDGSETVVSIDDFRVRPDRDDGLSAIGIPTGRHSRRRLLMAAAAIAAALALAAGVAWMQTGPEASESPAELAHPTRATEPARVLARLRGPVVPVDPAANRPGSPADAGTP